MDKQTCGFVQEENPLASLDLPTDEDFSSDAGDPVIVLTAEGDYVAFGDLLYDSVKQIVHFSGKQRIAIPEASTFLLLGVGLLLLIGKNYKDWM